MNLIARPRRQVAAGVLLAVMLTCSCGGDDDSAATTTIAPSTSTRPLATTAATSTAPTTTPASDEALIRTAFAAFFNGADRNVDKKVSLLQDGERYRQMLVDADADPRFQQLRAQVRAVRSADPTECTNAGVTSPCSIVTFDLLLGEFPALAAHNGPAVKISGSWKVGAKAWCDVVAIGGATCPS